MDGCRDRMNTAICSISSLRGKVSLRFGIRSMRRGAFCERRAVAAGVARRAIVGARHDHPGAKNLGGVAAGRGHAGRGLFARAQNHRRSRPCVSALSPGAVLPRSSRRAVAKIAGAGRRRHQSSGEITGVHRTFLDPTRKDKARVSSPRRSLGAILGHGVRFGRIDEVVDR